MWKSGLWVDDANHQLHFGGRVFPCDRDIEALAAWNGHALLLSSDTDCLSLWDSEGLIRTARVGVYPQDMAVAADMVVVCGGADGRVHLLSLPELQSLAEHPVPGMPERIAINTESAYILTLLADLEVETALLTLNLSTGEHAEITRFAGIPGALLTTDGGVWASVSEKVLHFPQGSADPDVVIEGFGLVRRMEAQAEGIWAFDALENRAVLIKT